jgi:hypothetical protein
MSRVEDDRQAARLAERQVEARRNEESQRNKKSAEASTFKKLVGQTQQQAQQAQARASQANVKDPHAQENIGQSAIAMLLESSEANQAEEAKGKTQNESAFKSRLGSKTFGENVKQTTKHEGEQGSQVRQSDQQSGTQQLKQANTEKANTSQAGEQRKVDAKSGTKPASRRRSTRTAAASAGPGAKRAASRPTQTRAAAEVAGRAGRTRRGALARCSPVSGSIPR